MKEIFFPLCYYEGAACFSQPVSTERRRGVPVVQERIREGGVGRRKRRGKWEERKTECPTEVLCLVIAQPGRTGERRDSAGKKECAERHTSSCLGRTFGRQETMDTPQVSGRKKKPQGLVI